MAVSGGIKSHGSIAELGLAGLPHQQQNPWPQQSLSLPLLTHRHTTHSDRQNYKVACLLQSAVQTRGLTHVCNYSLEFLNFLFNFKLPLIWLLENKCFFQWVCAVEEELSVGPIQHHSLAQSREEGLSTSGGRHNLK